MSSDVFVVTGSEVGHFSGLEIERDAEKIFGGKFGGLGILL